MFYNKDFLGQRKIQSRQQSTNNSNIIQHTIQIQFDLFHIYEKMAKNLLLFLKENNIGFCELILGSKGKPLFYWHGLRY